MAAIDQFIQEALNKVNDNYFRDQRIAAFTPLAESKTNLVVVPQDDITNIGQVPVIKKVLEQGNDK